MKKPGTRERIAAAVLTVVGVALAAALWYNPRMPGPTQLVDVMFKPAVKIIEQWSGKRSG